MNAVLFRSVERFEAFRRTLKECGCSCTVLDFGTHEWLDYDYTKADFLIYYPSFKYSSNHPLALFEVQDNLMHLRSMFPDLLMYPDPVITKYYNDKYRQYLFLQSHGYPIPRTYPLLSKESLDLAAAELGFPMVVKNRFGAGGGSVFRVFDRKQLLKYYNLSTLNLFNIDSLKYMLSLLSKRIFYYHLIKAKRMVYPFLSPPLLAQEFIKIDRDLKTVIGNYKVVEAHWRFQANKDQWKVNIDGGGIGLWGKVPDNAIELSERLAKDLQTSWLNIDLLPTADGGFLITEFSPVWHHYAYKEKPSFVYQDDYNIDTPLEKALDLERIIVESLIAAVKTPERIRT